MCLIFLRIHPYFTVLTAGYIHTHNWITYSRVNLDFCWVLCYIAANNILEENIYTAATMLYNKVRLGYGKHYFREIRKTFRKIASILPPEKFLQKINRNGTVPNWIDMRIPFWKSLLFHKISKITKFTYTSFASYANWWFFCITSLRSSLDMFRKQTKICGLLPHIHMNKGTA